MSLNPTGYLQSASSKYWGIENGPLRRQLEELFSFTEVNTVRWDHFQVPELRYHALGLYHITRGSSTQRRNVATFNSRISFYEFFVSVT